MKYIAILPIIASFVLALIFGFNIPDEKIEYLINNTEKVLKSTRQHYAEDYKKIVSQRSDMIKSQYSKGSYQHEIKLNQNYTVFDTISLLNDNKIHVKADFYKGNELVKTLSYQGDYTVKGQSLNVYNATGDTFLVPVQNALLITQKNDNEILVYGYDNEPKSYFLIN